MIKLKPMKKLLVILMLCAPILFAETILEQAQKLSSDKKPDEAIQLLKDYDKTHPDDVDVHELIQKIMLRNDKKDQALAEYKQRYEGKPNGLNGYLYAKLLDQPSEREKAFRKVIEQDPTSVWGYYGVANALMDQDRLQEGIDAGTAALTKVDHPAKLYYVMARIYRRMQDYEHAVTSMRECYKLDPTEENMDNVKAYEWIQIENTDAFAEKFPLADAWFKKYHDAALKPEGIEDDITLGEIAFLYAKSGKEDAVKELVQAARADLDKQELPPPGDDRTTFTRVKGAVIALQAWLDAKSKNEKEALSNLKLATENGSGSEMYYFSAQTYLLLGKKQDALASAIKAATYPPVYEGSHEMAEDLWKQTGHPANTLEAAMHKQREEFAPQRKALVLSQMVSQKFDPFEMTDPDGKKITDKDLSGKIVLINFWAVWCPPCREELPHWNQFYAAHKNDPDLLFASVGDEPWETILNYRKDHHYSFPVYRNEDYWKEFSVEGIPTLVLIDPKGAIRFRNAGFEEGLEYEETLLWEIDAVRKAK